MPDTPRLRPHGCVTRSRPSSSFGRCRTSRRSVVDRAARPDYKPALPTPVRGSGSAQVAQLVEHATENRSVGGSIPPLGTISPDRRLNATGPRSVLGWSASRGRRLSGLSVEPDNGLENRLCRQRQIGGASTAAPEESLTETVDRSQLQQIVAGLSEGAIIIEPDQKVSGKN